VPATGNYTLSLRPRPRQLPVTLLSPPLLLPGHGKNGGCLDLCVPDTWFASQTRSPEPATSVAERLLPVRSTCQTPTVAWFLIDSRFVKDLMRHKEFEEGFGLEMMIVCGFPRRTLLPLRAADDSG
jgi:hypothetical protein